MVPDRFSRRHTLHVSSVALLGLTGCLTSSTTRGGQDTPSPTASEPEYPHSVDSPESSKVRNPKGKPAVRTSAHSPEENLFESSASWDYEDWIVTAPGGADALDFSRATTGVNKVTDFIAETDFSHVTLLVHQYNVGTCETLHPTQLEWSTEFTCGDVACTGIKLSYQRESLDHDCQGTATGGSGGPPYSEGSFASEATFIRIPEQIQSYGEFGYQI